MSYDRWELLPDNQKQVWADTKYWRKKEYLCVKPTMSARQAGYGMKAAEDAVDDTQYNQPVAHFASGHTASQDSVANLTTKEKAAQQQQITALQAKYQSVTSVVKVMHVSLIKQPMMNLMQMKQ